ncbi:sialidase family protein [Actinophytocola algeriensis]|uniref:Exo-alpha-sialidase n=1 Tax=Actinophytocola algeriensis TaxID=1768010 RepID=A0A7W7Q3A9_9PSEU|nr:sialidase family protein [Actinophytocola algeriensis]MBB4906174.1 hypothetical protein [Actinophytocola algeriensis]MBE1472141.1 hypothetical protein [Actinophytocola algeriensis]
MTTVTGSADMNWVVCDNHETSPFYGNCYTHYGDNDTSELRMTTSSDGGRTWRPPAATGDHTGGSGGQPVVRTDGGATWSSSVLVAPLSHHRVAGGLKEYPLPSAEVDAEGTVYLVWCDRFDVAMYAPPGGLPVTGGPIPATRRGAA